MGYLANKPKGFQMLVGVILRKIKTEQVCPGSILYA